MQFYNPAPMDDEVGRPPPLAAVNDVDNNLNGADDVVAEQQFFWGIIPGNQANKELTECYEKVMCSGVKICLCYLKDQEAKIKLRKLLV